MYSTNGENNNFLPDVFIETNHNNNNNNESENLSLKNTCLNENTIMPENNPSAKIEKKSPKNIVKNWYIFKNKKFINKKSEIDVQEEIKLKTDEQMMNSEKEVQNIDISYNCTTTITDTDEPVRETWSKRLDFLMSIIGFSVDIAGIWRFPYLCLKNGGGAFLIPYTFMMCFLGLPLFYLELALGQYNKSGAITCWKKICPLLSGVGYAVVIIAFYTDFYYNVIISWGIYYLFNSFVSKLPWSNCGNSWNSKDCYEISNLLHNKLHHPSIYNNNLSNINSKQFDNYYINYTNITKVNLNASISSSEEFFYNKMYKFASNISMSYIGPILWENFLCLFVIYIICYFSMWKGVKTSGKVVWFTALFPYVVLMILLVQAFFIPGSMNGLEYYLKPNITLLADPLVWMEAASQVCFALGPGFGVLLAFSSYNDFHNNFYRDSLITVSVNFISSFFSGAVVFMYLGYMSEVTNKTINEVAKDGSSLIFIVYTEAISILPVPQFWSVIFFLMLLTLGLDSSFGGSEAIITAISDEYPFLRKKREIFVAVLFLFYLVIGLPSCTEGGYLIVEFLNNFAAVYSILIAVFFENIAVAWIYGTNRVCCDIQEMINIYPGRFWRYCWKFFTPCCLLFIIIMGIYAYQPLRVVTSTYYYEFPNWANIFGWCVALSSSLCIPVVAIYTILKAKGSLLDRIKVSITPYRDLKKKTNVINNQISTNNNNNNNEYDMNAFVAIKEQATNKDDKKTNKPTSSFNIFKKLNKNKNNNDSA